MKTCGFGRSALAVLLCLTMVFGAPLCARAEDTQAERPWVRFEDMAYERIDGAAYIERMKGIAEQIPAVKDFDEMAALYHETDELVSHFQTMYSMMYIHTSIDQSDPYWQAESQYMAGINAELYQKVSDIIVMMYESDYRDRIEAELERYLFSDIDAIRQVTDENRGLHDEEAAMVNTYKEKLATLTVVIGGKPMNLPEIMQMENTFVQVLAYDRWLGKHGPEITQLYVDLTRLRREIARSLGYSTMAEYEFAASGRDFTPAEAKRFTDSVAERLVPVWEFTYDRNYLSAPLDMTFQEFAPLFRDVVGGIAPTMGEAMDAMSDLHLCDTEVRPHKAVGGFTVFLSDYKLPFIVTIWGNDAQSAGIFAHEFGHFHQAYVGQKEFQSTTELTEVHSMTMELLFADRSAPIVGEEHVGAMQAQAVNSTLSTMTTSAYITAIELGVDSLSDEELTAENVIKIVNRESARFANDFGPKDMRNYSWVTVTHLFEMPLYAVSYSASSCIAMEIWQMAKNDPDKAVSVYLDLVYQKYGIKFLDSVEKAGLTNPFEDGRIRALEDTFREYLLEEKDAPNWEAA